jgi:hypothetical protein
MNSQHADNVYILDSKRRDVTGDGIPDLVYLTGHKSEGASGLYADDITLVVEDGNDGSIRAIKPAYNAGYSARLFLGDFDSDSTNDIKISIEAGGSGGYGIHYIYSFKNYIFRELFNFETYNSFYQYRVDYDDFFKVTIGSVELNKLFILDISAKGNEYLSQFYSGGGKLVKPAQGAVLALGALLPIVTDEKTNAFNLLAFQRIIGTINADTLGYMQNLLSWDGLKFVSANISAAVPGSNITSLV